MDLSTYPLTPDRWPDLVDLFGDRGPVARCWCMYWRIGAAYRQRPPKRNRADFAAVVQAGPPPGLLAYAGDLAVGWCQVTPREVLPHLERNWRVRRVDTAPVWALTCFFIRKGYRQRGITTALIRAAIDAARAAGAPALEAYPLDGDLSPSSTSTGYASTFARLGFVEVARWSAERPIMRFAL